MKNVGIVQGRLTPPDEGFQVCPKNWLLEFESLSSLSLSHIEWIVTSDDNLTNPLFHIDVSKYPISSICLDSLVNKQVVDPSYLSLNLKPVCDRLIELGMKNVTIPLLEQSSIEEEAAYEKFYDLLREYSSVYPCINFQLETELSLDKVASLCDISENVTVTYDTGNTTSFGIEHDDYVRALGSKIRGVHLKDRNLSGLSVEPGEGNTDFVEIFRLLNSINYNGPYTMQTARCTSGQEVDTITRHLKNLRNLYEQSL